MLLLAMMGVGCGRSEPLHGGARPVLALTEPTWRLVAFSQAVSQATALEETEITAVFTEEGRVAGTAGCNRYFGSYALSGDTLTIARVGTTRKMCPTPPVMDLESRFLSALDAIVGWERQGDQLDLTRDDGERLLRFIAQ